MCSCGFLLPYTERIRPSFLYFVSFSFTLEPNKSKLGHRRDLSCPLQSPVSTKHSFNFPLWSILITDTVTREIASHAVVKLVTGAKTNGPVNLTSNIGLETFGSFDTLINDYYISWLNDAQNREYKISFK